MDGERYTARVEMDGQSSLNHTCTQTCAQIRPDLISTCNPAHPPSPHQLKSYMLISLLLSVFLSNTHKHTRFHSPFAETPASFSGHVHPLRGGEADTKWNREQNGEERRRGWSCGLKGGGGRCLIVPRWKGQLKGESCCKSWWAGLEAG